MRELLKDSISHPLSSNVPIGVMFREVDSSLIYKLSSEQSSSKILGFHGRFQGFDSYDESKYAKEIFSNIDDLLFANISSQDF